MHRLTQRAQEISSQKARIEGPGCHIEIGISLIFEWA